jgi:hypothetical protein
MRRSSNLLTEAPGYGGAFVIERYRRMPSENGFQLGEPGCPIVVTLRAVIEFFLDH